MGERITPECDIYKTLQPKGLQTMRVIVRRETEGAETAVEMDVSRAVGKRGADRILRRAKKAVEPVTAREVAAMKAAEAEPDVSGA